MATSSAADIVKAVGGPGNIESLTHCATRLRFQLKDASGVDQKTVEAIPGVMGAVPQAGDRFQVVIGGGVQNVYNDIMALPDMDGSGGGTGRWSPRPCRTRRTAASSRAAPRTSRGRRRG